jgi:hypothetical protein
VLHLPFSAIYPNSRVSPKNGPSLRIVGIRRDLPHQFFLGRNETTYRPTPAPRPLFQFTAPSQVLPSLISFLRPRRPAPLPEASRRAGVRPCPSDRPSPWAALDPLPKLTVRSFPLLFSACFYVCGRGLGSWVIWL